MRKLLFVIMLVFTSLVYFSCDTAENPEDQNTDIPADPTGVTVPTPTKNNVLPSASFTTTGSRVKLNLLGLIDPTTNQPLTLTYNAGSPQSSNIFVQEDGIVQGLKVTKVGTGNILTADVVFLVDNSGSMGQEADSVAASIIEFANFLQASGLNVKFAIVGYDSYPNGGINFTNAQTLSTYLNRQVGTSRTDYFTGADSAALTLRAYNFGYAGGENGVIAAIFADSVYAWRSGAQRVFINFTDEPTQNQDGITWSNAQGCSLLSGKATVHTVFSGDTTYYNSTYWTIYDEEPAALSRCLGGTIKYIPEDATGLSLKDLPVAGALANSYLVEFVTAKTGVAHVVKVTIYTSTADGVQTFNVTY
jgi:von Willebrand factor type A domain